MRERKKTFMSTPRDKTSGKIQYYTEKQTRMHRDRGYFIPVEIPLFPGVC